MDNNKTRRPLLRRSLALGAAALGSALALTAAVAAPASAGTAGSAGVSGRHGTDYVALGDSLASGPGIPTQVDANCARSNSNYPSLIAAASGARLTDVSCSGASTANMTAPQGTAAPQFDALNRDTDLVTLSIGVNNIGVDGAGFTSIITTCAQLSASDLAGSPCRDFFNSTGSDLLRTNIANAAPKVAATLAGIHQRAPHARVFVIGYPDLFPDDGSSCTSAAVPFAAGDFAYLRDSEKALNSMLVRQARRGGARYVDTYKPTVGHDMCEPAGERWIEPVVPTTAAAPAHPNALGHQAMAGAIERSIRTCAPRRNG
jgi:lysophospholipase L1-like esterase